jgi:hypothetical protein
LFVVANPDSTNAYRRVVDVRDLGGERLREADPQIRYDLDDRMLAGLRRFLDLAAELGDAPPAEGIRLIP